MIAKLIGGIASFASLLYSIFVNRVATPLDPEQNISRIILSWGSEVRVYFGLLTATGWRGKDLALAAELLIQDV